MFSVREKVRDASSTSVAPVLAAIPPGVTTNKERWPHPWRIPLRQTSRASSSKSVPFSPLHHFGQVAEVVEGARLESKLV